MTGPEHAWIALKHTEWAEIILEHAWKTISKYVGEAARARHPADSSRCKPVRVHGQPTGCAACLRGMAHGARAGGAEGNGPRPVRPEAMLRTARDAALRGLVNRRYTVPKASWRLLNISTQRPWCTVQEVPHA